MLKQPTRNYQCTGNSIDECCKRSGLTNIKIGKIIGQGFSGKVYSGTATKEMATKEISSKRQRSATSAPLRSNIKIAIKMSQIKENQLDDAFMETELSFFMSDVGIGPEIYHAFYEIIKNPDYSDSIIYGSKRKISNGSAKSIVQYMIMEPMDMDCEAALSSRFILLDSKIHIVNEMISLLRTQIFTYNLYCSDIKPPNYLVNISDRNEVLKVRMIDFGANHCKFNKKIFKYIRQDKDIIKEIFYIIQIIQIRMFLLHIIKKTSQKEILEPIDDDIFYKKRCTYAIYMDKIFNDTDVGPLKHYFSNFNLLEPRIDSKTFIKNIGCKYDKSEHIKELLSIEKIEKVGFEKRAVLVDFIAKVADKLDLKYETFCTCVSIIDQTMSSLERSEDYDTFIKKIAMVSLYIAASVENDKKYKDYPPEILRALNVTDQDLHEFAKEIEDIYNYLPTVLTFVNLLIDDSNNSEECLMMYYYTCIVMMSDKILSEYKPSHIAESIVSIIRHQKLKEMEKCSDEIEAFVSNSKNAKLQNIRKIFINAIKEEKLDIII